MKRNRVKTYHHKKAVLVKDGEGNAYAEYKEAKSFRAESWPAGGKVQTEIYGSRLNYIHNIKIEDKYTVNADDVGRIHYVLANGIDIVEGDGVCLYVSGASNPDYKIISIKPYRHLRLEVERIDHRS